MPPIDVHIKAGSNAGRRLLLEQSPITLGRSPDNGIMIDLPFVSRRHAELRYDDGRWWLVNHSANGTRLNRQWVTDNPAAIEGAASITIGEDAVLDVAPQAQAAPGGETQGEGAPTDSGPGAPPGSGMTRRSKIWVGIGAYLGVMILLFVLLATLGGGDSDSEGDPGVPELTRQQIAAEIEQRPEMHAPDERRARAALDEARELFNRRDSERQARYRALEAYRIAIAYMPGHELPLDIDRRRYHILQRELADQVSEQYQRAYNLLRSQQHERASDAFRTLAQTYPATRDSAVFRNVQQHWTRARRALDDD